MKIQCPHCQAKIEIDNDEVKAFVKLITIKQTREEASRANAKKKRPGSLGNTRAAAKKPVEQ